MMNIDKLEAGRELDAMVAKEVMGWRQEYVRHITTNEVVGWWKEPEYLVPPGSDDAEKVPLHSTDIAMAWQVVDKLFEHCIVRVSNGDGDSRDCDILPLSPDGKYQPAHVSADTTELAICYAALQAVQ